MLNEGERREEILHGVVYSTCMKHNVGYRCVTPPCWTTGNIKPLHVTNETWLSEGLILIMD